MISRNRSTLFITLKLRGPDWQVTVAPSLSDTVVKVPGLPGDLELPKLVMDASSSSLTSTRKLRIHISVVPSSPLSPRHLRHSRFDAVNSQVSAIRWVRLRTSSGPQRTPSISFGVLTEKIKTYEVKSSLHKT